MQSKEDIERHYNVRDPWSYTANPEDARRKRYLIHMANLFGPYERVLDIGAGEGWITQDYPGKVLHGLELSEQARSRMPSSVKGITEPEGSYDLVVGTGILYGHYDWELFLKLITTHSSRYILLSNIKAWEHESVRLIPGKQLLEMSFPFHEYHQQLRFFER